MLETNVIRLHRCWLCVTAVGHLCCAESSIVRTFWVNFLLLSLKLSVIMYEAKTKWLIQEVKAVRHNQTHDPMGQKLTPVKCRAVSIFCVFWTVAWQSSTAQHGTEGLSIGMAACSYCICSKSVICAPTASAGILGKARLNPSLEHRMTRSNQGLKKTASMWIPAAFQGI